MREDTALIMGLLQERRALLIAAIEQYPHGSHGATYRTELALVNAEIARRVESPEGGNDVTG